MKQKTPWLFLVYNCESALRLGLKDRTENIILLASGQAGYPLGKDIQNVHPDNVYKAKIEDGRSALTSACVHQLTIRTKHYGCPPQAIIFAEAISYVGMHYVSSVAGPDFLPSDVGIRLCAYEKSIPYILLHWVLVNPELQTQQA